MRKNFGGNKRNKILLRKQYSSIHKSNQINDAYKQAVEAIRYIQSINGDFLHTGDVAAKVDILSKTRGDEDNIYKAVLDCLQGVLYENDRQVKCGIIKSKDYLDLLK